MKPLLTAALLTLSLFAVPALAQETPTPRPDRLAVLASHHDDGGGDPLRAGNAGAAK